ncbi:MAG: hypothetical protein BJ554DRAFT_2942 [Olpidium bornovanus]|uniref:Uncharacterized protein n=1 Tax=Olpidium bornovanus TaxID=278681 RepID=A0A8H8DLP6_9FUNG|nr:MAG: hypothetical protein BJ554DRAFT_2942 [Olpidium bornovanus]
MAPDPFSLRQSRPLDLTVGRRPLREPPPADRVDLVHKNDARLVLPGVPEHLSDEPRALSDVLVDDRGRHDLEEIGLEAAGRRPREKGFARSGRPVEQHAFGRLDPDSEE